MQGTAPTKATLATQVAVSRCDKPKVNGRFRNALTPRATVFAARTPEPATGCEIVSAYSPDTALNTTPRAVNNFVAGGKPRGAPADWRLFSVPQMAIVLISDENDQPQQMGNARSLPEPTTTSESVLELRPEGLDRPTANGRASLGHRLVM